MDASKKSRTHKNWRKSDINSVHHHSSDGGIGCMDPPAISLRIFGRFYSAVVRQLHLPPRAAAEVKDRTRREVPHHWTTVRIAGVWAGGMFVRLRLSCFSMPRPVLHLVPSGREWE